MPITQVNNIDLSYVESGKGEVIVFLHGYTGSTVDWAKQISFFSKKYRALKSLSGSHIENGMRFLSIGRPDSRF